MKLSALILFLPCCNCLLTQRNHMINLHNYNYKHSYLTGSVHTDREIDRVVMNDVKQLTLPLLVIWLSNPLLSLIDTACVGKMSSVIELASLAPATSLCDTGGNIMTFISTVTTTSLAKIISQNNELKNIQILNDSLLVSLFLGCGLSFLMLSCYGLDILHAFLGGPNISLETALLIPESMKYIKIRAIGYIPSLLTTQIQSYALVKRNVIVPLKTVALTSAINIIGDYILVIKLKYGLVGAAWATVLAQLFSFVYMTNYKLNNTTSLKKDYRPLWVRARDAVRFLRQCIAPAFATLGRCGVSLMTSSMSSCCGTVSVAAHQIAFSWFSLFCPIGDALSQTVINLLPSYTSPDQKHFTRNTWTFFVTIGKFSLVLGMIDALTASIPMYFPTFFTTSASVANELIHLCPLMSFALLAHSMTCFFEGVLLSIGETKYLGAVYSFNMIAVGFLYKNMTNQNIQLLWTIYLGSIVTRLLQFSCRFAWKLHIYLKQ